MSSECCSGLAKAFYCFLNFLLMVAGGINGGMGLFILMFPDHPATVGLSRLAIVITAISVGKIFISLFSLIGLAHGSRIAAKMGHYLWLIMAMVLLVECALLGVRLHEGTMKQYVWEALPPQVRQSVMLKLDCCGFEKPCTTGSVPACAPLIQAKQEANIQLMLAVAGASSILCLLASALAKCIKRPKKPSRLGELAREALPSVSTKPASNNPFRPSDLTPPPVNTFTIDSPPKAVGSLRPKK